METEKIHKPQSPAYFELVAGEKNYLCVNSAISPDERTINSVHLMHTTDNYLWLPYDEGKVEKLEVGQSCTINEHKYDTITIVVRIR